MPSDASTTKTHTLVLAGLGLWALIQTYLILSFDGTYDAGDSVMHYLYARHAFDHPDNLLDHWAKPVFTLLAAPLAQFGWVGMKAFQCILALASAWMAYRLTGSGKRHAQLAWAAPVLFLLAPEYFLAQFSGLTEILFGAILLGGVLALRNGRLLGGALLLSLLPFVRTEGFFLLLVFGTWLLWRRAWLPFLLLGASLVVYSVIGAFALGDLFWVFSQNPYDRGLANYGSGTWGHYFSQFIYVAGIPIYALTALGILAGILRLTSLPKVGGEGASRFSHWVLVHLPFLVYFGLHVVFWATGTGHSLGMSRVMIAVLPLGALIALDGLGLLWDLLPTRLGKLRWALPVLVLAYVGVFPFTANPAALKLPKDLQLQADQALARDAAQWMKSQDLLIKPVHVTHPSFAMYAGLDRFDSTAVKNLQPLALGVPPGTILVWDNWFSVQEDGVVEAFWEMEPGKYRLLWQADSTVAGARSEMRVYVRE